MFVMMTNRGGFGTVVSPAGGAAEPAIVARVRQGIVADGGDLPTRRAGAWLLT